MGVVMVDVVVRDYDVDGVSFDVDVGHDGTNFLSSRFWIG